MTTVTEMALEDLILTTNAIRKAVRYRNPETGQRHFCHLPEYREAYIRGLLERRALIKKGKLLVCN